MFNIFKEDVRKSLCGEVEERGNHLEAFIELVLTMSQTIEVFKEGRHYKQSSQSSVGARSCSKSTHF
jgi:hypothetical protein